MVGPQKAKSRTNIWSFCTTPGHICKGIKAYNKDAYDPCLFWHYSQQPGHRVYVTAHQQMNEQRKYCIYTYWFIIWS
jgi:hypothetical protein